MNNKIILVIALMALLIGAQAETNTFFLKILGQTPLNSVTLIAGNNVTLSQDTPNSTITINSVGGGDDNTKVNKTGDIMEGNLEVPSISDIGFNYSIFFDGSGIQIGKHSELINNYFMTFDDNIISAYETLDMGNHNINNVGNPVDNQDATNKQYVDTSDNLKLNKSGGNITGNLILSSTPSSVLSFDGVDDYVEVPNSASLNITNEITVETWIYPRSDFIGYSAHPLTKWETGGIADANVVLYYFGTTSGINRAILFYANRGGNWDSISYGYTLELNRWYHIALSYNSTTGGQLYVNGVPIGVPIGSGALASNTDPFRIGGGLGDSINGTIDEVRIYDRALSASEIANSYNGTYVNRSGLVLEMNMNEEIGLTSYDSSGYDNHGTLFNGVSWNYSYMPLKYNNEIYLNKTGTIIRK